MDLVTFSIKWPDVLEPPSQPPEGENLEPDIPDVHIGELHHLLHLPVLQERVGQAPLEGAGVTGGVELPFCPEAALHTEHKNIKREENIAFIIKVSNYLKSLVARSLT